MLSLCWLGSVPATCGRETPTDPALVIVQLLVEIFLGLFFPESLASFSFFALEIPFLPVDVTSRAVVYPVKLYVRDENGKPGNLVFSPEMTYLSSASLTGGVSSHRFHKEIFLFERAFHALGRFHYSLFIRCAQRWRDQGWSHIRRDCGGSSRILPLNSHHKTEH